MIVGYIRGNDALIRYVSIDFLERVDEIRDDAIAELVVDIDGDDVSPFEGFDDGSDGFNLRGIILGNTKEERAAVRSERRSCG